MLECRERARLGPRHCRGPHGKIWRFHNRTCMLKLDLYPDAETGAFRVLSYEVMSDDHNAEAKQLCETKCGAGVATE